MFSQEVELKLDRGFDSIKNIDYGKIEYYNFPIKVFGSGYFNDEYNWNSNINLNTKYEYKFEEKKFKREIVFDTEFRYNFVSAYSPYEEKSYKVNKLYSKLDFYYLDQIYFDNSDFFLSYDFKSSYQIFNTKNSYDDKFDNSKDLDFMVNLGKGRISNVTAKILFIHFQERFFSCLTENDVLKDSLFFSDKVAKDLISIINNLDLYYKKFDRPLKFIWNDIQIVIGNNCKKLDPFDIAYITEIFNIGSIIREEGFQYSGGVLFNYHSIDESLDTSIYENNGSSFGGIIALEWAKNLSVNTQIGTLLKTSISRRSYDSYSVMKYCVNSDFYYLWNIWDHFLVKNSVYSEFNYLDSNYKDGNKSFNLPMRVLSSFEYNIENNISIFFDHVIDFCYFYEPDYRSTDYYYEADYYLEFGVKYRIKM